MSQKVGRQISRLCRFISDNQYFARSGQHINIAVTVNSLFRQSNEYIARAGYLFNLWHAFRTKSQGRNRLRTAHFINLCDANFRSRCQYIGIYFAVLPWWYSHYNARYAGNFRRYGIHDNGRRIGGCTARHINADGINRRYLLPQHRTEFPVSQPGFRHLFFVEFFDIGNSPFDSSHCGRFNNCVRCSKFFFSYLQRKSSQISLVQKACIIK